MYLLDLGQYIGKNELIFVLLNQHFHHHFM